MLRSDVGVVTERQTSNASRFASASFSSSEKGPGFVFDFVSYRLQKMLTMKLGGKLATLLLIATPAILLGGCLYKMASNKSWGDSLFKAYAIMGRVPGCNAMKEETTIATIVVNFTFFAGMMTIAVAFGLVTSDINAAVQEVRSGNSRVLESGHTVILNYNEQLESILRQMAIAKHERGGAHDCVVLLADLKKTELDKLTGRATSNLDLDVRARYGCTHDPTDLKKVAADKASTIIWLDPPDTNQYEATARRLAAIASLESVGAGSLAKAHMVVQTPECTDELPSGLPGVNTAIESMELTSTNLDVVEMYDAQNLQRLLAQCAIQPGLGKIISNVLHHSADTSEFYLKHYKQLSGLTFGEARRYFRTTDIPCGVLNVEKNELELNPSDDLKIGSMDNIVVLAKDVESAKIGRTPMPAPAPWTQEVKRSRANGSTYEIVVLSFTENCASFVKNIKDFAEDKNLKVTVVSREKPANLPKSSKNLKIAYHKGDPATNKVLSDLKLSEVDSLVVDIDQQKKSIADAQVVTTLLQVQNLMKDATRSKKDPLHLVVPVNSPTSQQVVKRLIDNPPKHPQGDKLCTVDILLPQELSSGVLTQVATSPKLNMVFKDLLNASGVELQIRSPKAYGLLDRGKIFWRDVMDAARTGDAIAIGYIDKDGKMVVGPNASSKQSFSDGDKLVVLAHS